MAERLTPSPTSSVGSNLSSSTGITSKYVNGEKSNSKNTAAIIKAYKDIVNDPKTLDEAANYLYHSLLDDAILNVFLEIHHIRKSGNLKALEGEPDDESGTAFRIVNLPNFDIFGISTAKKPMDCTCPNCDKPVSCARFAPHLEKCMGMGRISSRIASRRLATREASNASASAYLQANGLMSDDDEEIERSEKRRKKTRNGKKNHGRY